MMFWIRLDDACFDMHGEASSRCKCKLSSMQLNDPLMSMIPTYIGFN
jgi:hypothetical protein